MSSMECFRLLLRYSKSTLLKWNLKNFGMNPFWTNPIDSERMTSHNSLEFLGKKSNSYWITFVTHLQGCFLQPWDWPMNTQGTRSVLFFKWNMFLCLYAYVFLQVALKVIYGSLVQISRIFYYLNYQDLPEFFEDNISVWMTHFLQLLETTNPLLR